MKRGTAWILSVSLAAALLTGCGPLTAPSSAAATPTPTVLPTASPVPTPLSPTPTPLPIPTETPPPQMTYVPSERTDTDYTNWELGLYFLPDTNMVLYDDETMALVLPEETGTLTDNEGAISTYEMAAVNFRNDSSIIIMNQKLPTDEIDEEQYRDMLKWQLYASQVSAEDLESATLGETEFTGMEYSVDTGGQFVTQTIYLKKVGLRMYVLAFSYTDEAQYEALLACFHTITSL